jgi:hypothetical protein
MTRVPLLNGKSILFHRGSRVSEVTEGVVRIVPDVLDNVTRRFMLLERCRYRLCGPVAIVPGFDSRRYSSGCGTGSTQPL